ncbi:peptidoglycan-binding domain-containing protein [Streptomyces sp. rh34]|uniref:peptidoglycan-binding domain-containing protein n=1 Tax=Streptomyces sp. rh34 TaxID=2034272 RepID=UPI000BF10317|nr:peptidoglycan-binding domain-containing protein [Streptomyces sp. rh34]
MTGHACPECGRRTAGEPGTEHRAPCRCGAGALSAQLSEDEQRAARTAEIAAAEDFDPLRIRPYVTLTDPAGAAGGGDEGGDRFGEPRPGSGAWEGAAATMPLFLGGGGPDAGVGDRGTPGGAPYAVPDESRRRTAGANTAAAPDPVRPRRRRPFGALAVGAAVAAVVGTAAFAGGLFGGDDSKDEALPEATTSVPDTEDEPAASVAPSPSASATPTRTQSPSATPSASRSPSASPTKSRKPAPTATTTTSASPKASASSTPEGSAPPAAPPAGPSPGLTGSSLRPGDRGPEVAELQSRLRTVEEWLYPGPVDGSYSDQVAHSVAIYQSYKAIQGDPTGVYGPNTRRVLEKETNGRGRH